MQRKRTSRHSDSLRGFTLIEVLLVLVILVVLGSIAATSFFGAKDQADINAAKGQISMLTSGIDMYKFNTSQLPDDLKYLYEKPSDSAIADKWGGPHLDKPVPKDPWGNDYKYSAKGKKNPEGFDVWSMGPDGQDGTDDDIGNWQS